MKLLTSPKGIESSTGSRRSFRNDLVWAFLVSVTTALGTLVPISAFYFLAQSMTSQCMAMKGSLAIWVTAPALAALWSLRPWLGVTTNTLAKALRIEK